MATEEIQISELELADEVLADMVLPVDTATDTKAVTLKQLKAWLGSSLPSGFIVASVGKINDERFTLLDGKTLSRVGTYEAFCNKVVENVQAGRWSSCTEDQFNQEVSQTGQCNKFVVTNDYVRIPKFGNCMYSALIDGKIPVAGNGNGIGLYNGKGYGSWMVTGPTASIGNVPRIAKDKYGTAGTDMGVGNGTEGIDKRLVGLTTDASKSGIEGTLSTNPMTIYYYMVVSTEGQTASVDVDINKIYEDLELKANSNLSNVASVASSFKEQSVGWGMPDYSAGVSWVWNSENIAPCDGLVMAYWYGNNNQQINITIGKTSLDYVTRDAAGMREIFPISKGDTFKASGGYNAQYVKFFPFKGVK